EAHIVTDALDVAVSNTTGHVGQNLVGRREANASAGRAEPLVLDATLVIRILDLGLGVGSLNISLDTVNEAAGLEVVTTLGTADEAAAGDIGRLTLEGALGHATGVAGVQTDIATGPVMLCLNSRRRRSGVIRINGIRRIGSRRSKRNQRSGNCESHGNPH